MRVYTARSYPLSKIAMEGMNEEMGKVSWENQKMIVGDPALSPDFHLDTNKVVDPVERLLEDLGSPTAAFDELMDRLDKNKNDTEARRMAELLVNRLEDLSSRLRGKIGH